MIELLNIDCLDYMKHMPNNAFDLAIVDPPYGIGMGGGKVGNSNQDYKQFHGEDKNIPPPEYFRELKRISTNQIIWGGNYFDLPPTPCFIVWDKVQPEEFTMAMCEFAWTSFKTPAKIFKQRVVSADIERIHPTQKPVKLYEWLLSTYVKPGDRILDTHLGSGSSAIAAHYGGFDFVGMEIDTDYFKAAKARFDAGTAQLDIFGQSGGSDWNKRTEVKKGCLGESLVEKYLAKRKQTIYKPITDQAHPVDRVCASPDKNQMYIVEVKTKARRKYYPDTGFDFSKYREYLNLQLKHSLEVYVFFVDEESGTIYGGLLDDISRMTTITHKGNRLEYPLISKGIIYFPVENMTEVEKINPDVRGKLEALTTKNTAYLKGLQEVRYAN